MISFKDIFNLLLLVALLSLSACNSLFGGANNQNNQDPLIVRDVTPMPNSFPNSFPNFPNQQQNAAPSNIPNNPNLGQNGLNLGSPAPLNLPMPQADPSIPSAPISLNRLPVIAPATFRMGDRVYFDFNSAKLNREALVVLSKQARWLKENPKGKVVIEGHDDARGSDEYSYKIAMHRAMNVKKYLVSKDIDEKRIKVVSYGKAFPEYSGTTEAVFSKNRRAVTVITNY